MVNPRTMARMVVRSKDWRPRSGDVVEGCEVEVLEADAKRNGDGEKKSDSDYWLTLWRMESREQE
jgi:hypothetical protein